MSEAISAIISAGISALIAAAVALVVNFQGNAHFFSTTVSAERMVWIKDMRGLCADLCSICEQYDSGNPPPPKQYAMFLRARNGILVHLDPPKWYPKTDGRLISLLADPDFMKVKANIPQIRELIMTIIKSEWNKVKIEAGNSRWKVRRIEALQKKMEQEHEAQ